MVWGKLTKETDKQQGQRTLSAFNIGDMGDIKLKNERIDVKENGDAPGNVSSDNSSSNISGASLLMLTQALSKLLTFMLNQMLVRLISPTLYGVSAYLDFLYSTTLFFSREAERLAIQRTPPASDLQYTYKSIVNFGYVPLIVGLPISAIIFVWQFKSDTFTEINHIAYQFKFTVLAYWLLAIVELFMEPIYALNQYKLNFGKRSKYEAIAVFLRCVSTFAVVFVVSKLTKNDGDEFLKNGLLLFGFALGQLIYSLTLFFSYNLSFSTFDLELSLFPAKISTSDASKRSQWINDEVLQFWKISFIQMMFKQVLTEGDKFLVNGLFSVEERGVYSVMNNYGSIIVRLLFQPIEESVRLSITRSMAHIKQTSVTSQNLKSIVSTLKYLIIFYVQLSILIFLAGSFNASYLLKVLLGGKSSNWLNTELFELFPLYVTYIPFLAFNGVLEAFFSAAANRQQTISYSYFMSGLSICIVGVLYIFIEKLGQGISGLIWANILNMLLRIAYCSNFIREFFSTNRMPFNYQSIFLFLGQNIFIALGSFYLNYMILDKSFASNSFTDLIKSGFVCIICLGSMLSTIRHELTPLVNKYFHKKQA